MMTGRNADQMIQIKMMGYLPPKLVIECASNQATFKEENNSIRLLFRHFKFQVIMPIFDLATFQWLNMKVWPFDVLLKSPTFCGFSLCQFEDTSSRLDNQLTQRRFSVFALQRINYCYLFNRKSFK
jgi:hypothetical protein